jgi:hypothetical protein
MNPISPKNPFHPFRHELDTFSTDFQQLFAYFNKFLVFFVFASKIRQLLITSEACCHFAPPRATCVTCAVKREACLSLRAAETRRALTSRRRPIFLTESKGNFE